MEFGGGDVLLYNLCSAASAYSVVLKKLVGMKGEACLLKYKFAWGNKIYLSEAVRLNCNIALRAKRTQIGYVMSQTYMSDDAEVMLMDIEAPYTKGRLGSTKTLRRQIRWILPHYIAAQGNILFL